MAGNALLGLLIEVLVVVLGDLFLLFDVGFWLANEITEPGMWSA